MKDKKKKDKKSKPLPKVTWQASNAAIRASVASSGIADLQNARNYPIYGCWIMAGWQEAGMTPILVARKQDDDQIIFGRYLVDLYCLGIKDADVRMNYSRNRFNRELTHLCADAPEPCAVELAHEIIYGALDYAKQLGFEAHPEFYKQKADLILDPPDAHPRTNEIQFGKDGKPFFFPGPNDTEMKRRLVIDTLLRTCGEGNFDYILPMDGFEDICLA